MQNVDYQDITNRAIWNASSVQNGSSLLNLFDGNKETVWQSDSLLPHSITAQFSKLTYISSVHIYICSKDDNYMTIETIVEIGSDISLMNQVGVYQYDVTNGWNIFHLDISTIFLRILITKNNKEGRNSKIRMLKVLGNIHSNCMEKSLCFVSSTISQKLSIY